MASSIDQESSEFDIQAYLKSLPLPSTDSDDSGHSDDEKSEVPLAENKEYQEFLSTLVQLSFLPSSTCRSIKPDNIILLTPPKHPAHFRCEPAWYWDRAKSPQPEIINSDNQEVDIVQEEENSAEESEEGEIAEPSASNQSTQKRKSHGNRKNQEDYNVQFKKNKTANILDET